jgi:decaprenylphospho-beta-D-ribofuranose 2-oxidase
LTQKQIKTKLSGFNNYPEFNCKLIRPEKYHDLVPVLPSCIARGSGLSYSDAAINEQGSVISTTRLNRFLSFDCDQGILVAEAGLTLREICEVVVPNGWFLPVIPGSSGVSLGGAIAADVHGKNHVHAGSFSQHIAWIELITACGDRLHCSSSEQSDIFWATVGGMGLTGLISIVSLALKKIESPFMRISTTVTPDLGQTLARLEDASCENTYSVAWLDGYARGVVTTASHVAGDEEVALQKKQWPEAISIPFKFPFNVINSLSIYGFNYAYYAAQKSRSVPYYLSYQEYFFPLEKIKNWSFLYGKNGFIQYQCVFPSAHALMGIQELLEFFQRHGVICALIVLKKLGQSNQASLSFAKEGITIAIDIPFSKKIFDILESADGLILKYDGRVYLAKDVRLTQANFFQMYPNYLLWKKIKYQVDPKNIFQSALSTRLLL